MEAWTWALVLPEGCLSEEKSSCNLSSTSCSWGSARSLDVSAMHTVCGKETAPAAAMSVHGSLACSGVPSGAIPVAQPVSGPLTTHLAFTLTL